MGFQSFTSFVNTSLSLQQWRMCCSVVHLTRYVAVLGILVSGMCIAPPTYTYLEGRDYSTLMPGRITLQERLLVEYHKKSLTLSSLENLQGLLNCVGENAGYGALAVVCLAATNILVDFLLLIGSCCRVRCLLLPWLILSMMELIILGCPAVVFFSTPPLLVLVAMSIWLT